VWNAESGFSQQWEHPRHGPVRHGETLKRPQSSDPSRLAAECLLRISSSLKPSIEQKAEFI